MNAEPKVARQRRPFWQKLALLLAIVLGVVALYSGVSGHLTARDLSETLFWSAVILGLVAAVPIAGDPGGALLARRALLEGKKLDDLAKANREARRQNRPLIALFGLAAVIMLALSLLLSALASASR